VGLKLALLGVTVALATPIGHGVDFLRTRQLADGSFADSGQTGYPQLTAWAVLGLRATDALPAGRGSAIKYLITHDTDLKSATDIALVALAEHALGADAGRPLSRLRALERPDGSFDGLVNGTAWGVLALRGNGSPVHTKTIRWLLAHQTRTGGWGWSPRGGADSNDTAGVVQALRAAKVSGRPIRRAVRYLLTFHNRDGGFELLQGRGSDAQSTAWAIQALVAAGASPPRNAFTYLRRLQRGDGSFRYSVRYATTPVWVTAQVLMALARKPLPLR
jgi:prenyltransferase/squalene oxidase-like repeat protein